MKPTRIDKARLLTILRDITRRIEADDSFDGSLEYFATPEPGVFEVQAAYRVDNTRGQGGMVLVGTAE